jgi:DNA-binding transcriptional MerR regulator
MTSFDGLTMTIREASRATGLSVKALRRRVERGTLSAELVGGVRRVRVAELVRAGLMVSGRGERAPAPDTALLRRVAALEARVELLERMLGER